MNRELCEKLLKIDKYFDKIKERLEEETYEISRHY